MINDLLLKIVSEQKTPFYVYELEYIKKAIQTLYNIFPRDFQLLYSIKANPSLGLLSYIKDNVDGVEVASEGELFLALKSGIAPEKIYFIGPGKTKDEIEYAIAQRIAAIVIESMSELMLVNEIALTSQYVMPILIRVNPLEPISNARFKMGGEARQFGIDEEIVEDIILYACSLSNISFEGIHIYYGTQILDTDSIIQSFENVLIIINKLESNLSLCLKTIDFGGGFGVPYFQGESEIDIDRLSQKFSELFKGYSKLKLSQKKLLVESGRYIVADCGYFVSKILYKKCSRNKVFLITDGGSNNHSSAAGIGRFIRNNFPISILGKSNSTDLETVTIVGPLCTPTDVIASDILLPVTAAGDYIVIHKSGAYGFSASMNGFLSHSTPAEFAIQKNSYNILRERGKREDYGKNQ